MVMFLFLYCKYYPLMFNVFLEINQSCTIHQSNKKMKYLNKKQINNMNMCQHWTFLFLLLIVLSSPTFSLTPTTAHLREIIIGRCFEGVNSYARDGMVNVSSLADCNGYFGNFTGIWAYKDPLSVSINDYEPFFNVLLNNEAIMAPRNRALFWSRSNRVAHIMSNNFPKKFVTLEDTIWGQALNGLSFCGCSTANAGCVQGIDHANNCPYGLLTSATNIYGAMISFWALSSKKFAQNARGDINILMSAEAGPAYRNTSFFHLMELPNLSTSDISSVRILLIKNNTIKETCSSGSILSLISDVKNHFSSNVQISCVDDYPAVRYILCADNPTSQQCSFVSHFSDRFVRVTSLVSTSTFVVGLILGVISMTIGFCVYSWRAKRLRKSQQLLLEGHNQDPSYNVLMP